MRLISFDFLCLVLLASSSQAASARGAPLSAIPDASERIVADVVLKGGTLVDGTGAARRKGDVALRGSRIVAVGSFEVDAKTKVVDVSSLIVAPGFIDLHTHSDDAITQPKLRLNGNYVTQGVTTIVTGNCGLGVLDVQKYLAAINAHGAGTNVIHLIPLGPVRSAVMGNDDRAPSHTELESMKQLVARGMAAGAWGISSGLIYVPGRYAATSELIELARVAGRHGGLYASHIRSEGRRLAESIDEAIAIGKGAGIPVHISHLKASGKAYWGTIGPAIDKIAEARRAGQIVTADQYPYIASATQLAAMVVPHWAIRGTAANFARLAADSEKGRVLRREIEQGLQERDGGASLRIARYAPRPEWAGLDLLTIATREQKNLVDLVLEIQSHGGAAVVSFGISEADVPRRDASSDLSRPHRTARRICPARATTRTREHTGHFPARSGTRSTTS